jgi:conjugal transfer pilus assembly protein TraV
VSVAPALARLLAVTAPMLLAGCTTLGGHVSGQFSCRAPQGDCAPSRVIDAKAISGLTEDDPGAATGPRAATSARATPGDLARTREHMLKIVFPAHVDSAGILHDEATAWAVAEPSDWAARLRIAPIEGGPRALARAIGERLKAAHAEAASDSSMAANAPSDLTLPSPEDPQLSLTSPGGPPPTPRGVDAGAQAPGIEGFDTPAPSVRTPRSTTAPSDLVFPSVEAIDAAHARFRLKPGKSDARTTGEQKPAAKPPHVEMPVLKAPQ